MMSKNGYIEVEINAIKQNEADTLAALFSEIGFEGFEEIGDSIKAYINKDEFDEAKVKEIAEPFSLSYQIKEIAPQNWNAVWESHFEPVVIDDFVAIRAHFHQPHLSMQHEIIITPKMSFGTGHHATTTMMIMQMRHLNFVNKTVLDFGTGTGILSILAEKLGAASVVAIDNDEWSIENSKENIAQNKCGKIKIELRNDANVHETFDVILANINRNVILDNFAFLSSQLNKNGLLLLSGLLAEDEQLIQTKATHYQLQHAHSLQLEKWISLLFSR